MTIYTFWNNKGGTGKTSLAFQAICRYAQKNRDKRILALDLCPQANLSELFLGGLEGKGSENLLKIQGGAKRTTIGGYFQDRMPSPYIVTPNILMSEFIVKPYKYNPSIPTNIDLVCGDPLLEMQSNAVSTLANANIPGTNTWICTIDWVKDFLDPLKQEYTDFFFDTNPSFSIYTQMTLAASERLIFPVMADDSSKRAIQNALSLVYGILLPSPIYQSYAFNAKLSAEQRPLPKVHLIVKNRLTQYMGTASAYHAVLRTIDDIVRDNISPGMCSFSNVSDAIVNVRDFQTTGVVAFARGAPFFSLSARSYSIQNKRVNIREDYLQNCIDAIDSVVAKL